MLGQSLEPNGNAKVRLNLSLAQVRAYRLLRIGVLGLLVFCAHRAGRKNPWGTPEKQREGKGALLPSDLESFGCSPVTVAGALRFPFPPSRRFSLILLRIAPCQARRASMEGLFKWMKGPLPLEDEASNRDSVRHESHTQRTECSPAN